MSKKGSKCVCKDSKSQKCGTYCRKQGPAAQRKIITDLLLKEQRR